MNHPIIDSPVATRRTGSRAAFVCQRNAARLGYTGLIPSVAGRLYGGLPRSQPCARWLHFFRSFE